MRMSDVKPSAELCSLSINASVANLTLERSDVYNALNVQLISEIIDILDWTTHRSVGRTGSLRDHDGAEYLRVLVLRGAGRHFCAGADINMMRDAGVKSPEENRIDSERLDRLFNSLWAHPCFTISAVQGVALGGGAGLIACSDHVIALDSSRIALSEAKLGILPAVIGPYVYRRVGSAQFRRLAMLAGHFDGHEALNIGMVDQVSTSLEETAEMVDATIATVMSTGPVAVTEAKSLTQTLDNWRGTDEDLRRWTLDKTSEMRGSPEGQEGLSAFLDRRPPAWSPEDQDG
ncbi:MAG: enoyl-CoA hydratase-related protein [Candidatus Poseidoniales archaeon]|nr:enoyl-CoA hydratase-related protein [Candidatus Poseidoniales archaeon]